MSKVGTKTQMSWTGIDIKPGTKYYTNVVAVNTIGLKTEFSSDGFLLDTKPPTEGVLFNTKHHSNKIYQSTDEPIFFSWHGFDDKHSFISHFLIAFEVNNISKNSSDSLAFINAGDNIYFPYPGQPGHGDVITAHIKAIDAAGHESRIVTSDALYIDGTHPESFECHKFSVIKDTSIHNITQKSLIISESVASKPNDLFQIVVKVDITELDFMAHLSIGDMTMSLPFLKNADKSVLSEYIYLVEQTDIQNVNVTIELNGVRKNATVYTNISKCSGLKITKLNTEAVIARQISQDEISVCVQTVDTESGIGKVSVGVGSIPHGLEILDMRPLPLHRHDVIKTNFTHGMTLFVSALVENHAGMSALFTSKPLAFDMTPPMITEGAVGAIYSNNTDDTTVVITANWMVSDEESTVKTCEYCIGKFIVDEIIKVFVAIALCMAFRFSVIIKMLNCDLT